ncbi:MAG: phenylacetate--CoA ligase family protein [Candidatus Aminicenantia bacterium]
MLKNQWKSLSELESLQNNKLQKLIHHAYNNVPYYRHLFDSVGLKPYEINSVEDLARIPITSKKQLQNSSLDEIVDRNVNLSKCVRITTSGSTGIPLRLFYTRGDFSTLNMNWIRPLLIYGVKPWHKRLEITGPHNISNKKKWYNYLGLWNNKMISLFKSPQEWVNMLHYYKPDILYGYSGSLKLLAKYVLDNEIININPKFIFGVSELVDDECRELIYKAFKKKLIDLYGAAEAGCIAWQCKICNGYHINMDTVIVEFLQGDQPASPGTHGRIIVTNLHSFAMPIMRYELGDIGIPSKEKSLCERELSLMEVVEGRSDAFVVLPSGNLLSPLFFFGIMKPIKEIEHWKVFQRDIKHLTIFIVPSKDFSSNTINHIKQRVEENIGEKMEIKVELVEKIPVDSSGKVRTVISQVKSPF